MEVTKVKHRDGKTTIIGTAPNVNDLETVALRSCADAPTPAFKKAFEAVSNDITSAVGVKGATFAAAFNVYEVTVDKDEKTGRRGFVFGAMLDTPWGPMKAPLPRMIERTESESDASTLSDVAVKRIDVLLAEAKGYYAGGRVSEQTDAFKDAAGGGE